ncbi:MAG TPA: hypothetical protein VH482_05665 [Thermomicrobiales bacterium]|jgi:hypothetical protein
MQTGRTPTREEQVLEVMRTTNLMRPEAEAAVASRYCEDISDIWGVDGPLTPVEKRRLGMGRSIVEFMESESEAPGEGQEGRTRS